MFSANASPVPMPIIQSCWVVPDMEEAISGWLKIGVGPFFTYEVEAPQVLYRGSPAPFYIEVAIAQAGPMQIELIKQLNDGPSAYRDIVPEGESGFHHVCRAYGGYDEAMALLAAQQIPIAMSGSLGPTRFCYADTRKQIGCMMEFVVESSGGAALHQLVREGAVNWDGQDPIRKLNLGPLFGSL